MTFLINDKSLHCFPAITVRNATNHNLLDTWMLIKDFLDFTSGWGSDPDFIVMADEGYASLK
jgi:hypothetical protein